MSVTINKTDGTVLTTVADGAVDTSTTGLAFIGRLYRNYGELVNENFAKLLENFANSSSPSAPIVGQLWYDTSDKKIKVYRSTGFVTLGVSVTSSSEPNSPSTGDQWYDTVDEQLKLWNGSAWALIGPAYSATQGRTGAFAVNIADTTLSNHIAVAIYQQGTILSIFSKDSEYTPSSAISGFTSIKTGLNLSSTTGFKFHGTATNADTLDSVSSESFMRSDEDDTITGTLTIDNDDALVIGDDSDFEVSISGSNIVLKKVNSGNFQFYTDNTELAFEVNDDMQAALANGSSNTPSLSFQGDPDTGMFWKSANVIGFTSGGSEKMSINSGGVTITGTMSASAVSATTVSGTTGTFGTIGGTPTFSGVVNFSSSVLLNGSTTIGNASTDVFVINSDTVSIPNGLTFEDGDVVVDGNLSVTGTISTASSNLILGGNLAVTGDAVVYDDLFVQDELLVQYDTTGIASFRVTTDGRVLVNAAGPKVSADNVGDMTLGDLATVYAANTAKYWAAWSDTGTVLQLLGGYHVASVTRLATGRYKLTFDYNMTDASYYSVVGMGSYGNMKVYEYPVGGDYVTVETELYDYTDTNLNDYMSIAIYGV